MLKGEIDFQHQAFSKSVASKKGKSLLANTIREKYLSLEYRNLALNNSRNRKVTNIMGQGKVKWFNAKKGFGFIEPNDGSKDVFVHRDQVKGLDWDDGLREGEELEYDVEQTPKGLAALNVERKS